MQAMFITELDHGVRKIIWQKSKAFSSGLYYLNRTATPRAHGRHIGAHSAATDDDDFSFCWGKQHLFSP
jgi:hypothetical protein